MEYKPEAQVLQVATRAIRQKVLNLSYQGRVSHVGSCLSVVDILTAIYWGGLDITPENATDNTRDRVIFGKGHAAVALLSALAERGFFPWETLSDFNKPGGKLQEHPGPDWPRGVETASGSLGHALPLAVGCAMAAKIQDSGFRVCAVMGDGECDEGSVWEAAMFAGGQGLNNLCAIVDCNRWQGIGRPAEISAFEPIAMKWEAFGWRTVELDGHDPVALKEALKGIGQGDKPTAIIARTVKGKGVSFMEDDNNWHYRVLSEEEWKSAMAEVM